MDSIAQQAVLDRARLGDDQARGEFLQSFRSYVRVIVWALQHGRLQARLDDSDMIQDAMLQAHRSFADFRGTTVAEFSAWLRQIALRCASRTVRDNLAVSKRAVGHELADDGGALAGEVADSASSPSAHAIRHEQAARMAEALARLPDDMQQVLLGRHMDELSHAEIAQRLGRSAGAVRVLYTRALRRLRELYGEP